MFAHPQIPHLEFPLYPPISLLSSTSQGSTSIIRLSWISTLTSCHHLVCRPHSLSTSYHLRLFLTLDRFCSWSTRNLRSRSTPTRPFLVVEQSTTSCVIGFRRPAVNASRSISRVGRSSSSTRHLRQTTIPTREQLSRNPFTASHLSHALSLLLPTLITSMPRQ